MKRGVGWPSGYPLVLVRGLVSECTCDENDGGGECEECGHLCGGDCMPEDAVVVDLAAWRTERAA